MNFQFISDQNKFLLDDEKGRFQHSWTGLKMKTQVHILKWRISAWLWYMQPPLLKTWKIFPRNELSFDLKKSFPGLQILLLSKLFL